jgi:hypothetical protein
MTTCRRAIGARAGLFALVTGLMTGSALAAQDGLKLPDATVSDACRKEVNELNAALATRRVEALMAAAAALESGRCVARDNGMAAEYLTEAARLGHRPAALRMARKFGRGGGLPQSYANAGAWLAGKGLSEERIEPWDYSVGYAYTVVSTLLSAVTYPPRDPSQPAEIGFVVGIDARQPKRVTLRRTSAETPATAAWYDAMERALQSRLPEVLTWLAPPDASLLVAASVSIPVSLRYDSPTDLKVLENEPLLR